MSTLFLVHAHPDDEAISTGGVMRKAHEEGHRVVLVTSTRGEEGEIHQMDEAATRPRLAEVRTEELRRAGEILGVDRQEFLGFRDSGMAGVAANEHPDSFHQASLETASEGIAALLREERPDVVVTYGADGLYGHPDHVKAHQATVAALDLLESEGWQPAKAYFVVLSRDRLAAWRRMAQEQGLDAFDSDSAASRLFGTPDEEITTVVDVTPQVQYKRAAFSAHASQNDPDGPLASMAGSLYEAVLGTEYFVLARGGLDEREPEADLFAGIVRSAPA
jgi:N-acetyl-1-D-myo-inositol-2-amino-2-deoxy-alpha-D-glucopyranoside deacetylase